MVSLIELTFFVATSSASFTNVNFYGKLKELKYSLFLTTCPGRADKKILCSPIWLSPVGKIDGFI